MSNSRNSITISKRRVLVPIVAFAAVVALILGVFAMLNVSISTADNSKAAKLATAEANITDAASLRQVVESAGFEKPTIKDKFLSTQIEPESTVIDISKQSSPINITRAGMFILTGTNDNMQVKINAPESADVRIVLDNVDMTSKTGAVIDSEVADHTIIISKPDTHNTLTDAAYGWVDETSEDDTPNGVIYAVSDLVVIGEGALKINANGKFGISSHDDINLDANVDITSKGSAIHGTDSVYVLGGSYSISSGNDGMHAKDNLVINAGNINITKSKEGLEGTTISVTGGDINIIASDDGVNASDQQTESITSGNGGKFESNPDMPAAADGNAKAPSTNGGKTPVDDGSDSSFTPGRGGGGPKGGHGGPRGSAGAESDGALPPQDGGPDLADNAERSSSAAGRTGGGTGGGGARGGGEQEKNNVWLYVSGGTITVTINGRGDGIDSNGHILQTGGIIKSNDNATGGDGPFDYNGIYGFFPENGAQMWANGKQLSSPINTM